MPTGALASGGPPARDPTPPAGAGAGPGFHGKLPAKGDFVTRRLPRSFVESWDAWLQSAIACSRDQLGEGWLEAYLNGPIWRFALAAGLCGDSPMTGVLMPSVDRVNRHFPLTLAVAVPGCDSPAALPVTGSGWYRSAEDLALSSLDEDFDFERFDAAVEALGAPEFDPAGDWAGAAGERSSSGWRIGAGIDGDPAPAYAAITDRLLRRALPRYGVWWTAGSGEIAPTLLVCPALPPIGGFAALIDGQWPRWGWSGQPAFLAADPDDRA